MMREYNSLSIVERTKQRSRIVGEFHNFLRNYNTGNDVDLKEEIDIYLRDADRDDHKMLFYRSNISNVKPVNVFKNRK